MADDQAELSSLTSVLDDLIGRVNAIVVRRVADDPDDLLANELFEIDRLLQGASRRMVRVLRSQ
ncbi:MAG: hypothetical protein OEU32_02770 [Acidimicrobiia bacterium]|nr:hypothetical protein [Acidimicrobiia bacterium]